MTPSVLGPAPAGDDLLALRKLIARLAPPCGLDLADRQALTRFLQAEPGSAQRCPKQRELRAMLILLFRREASSSEDLGRTGLLDLRRSHDDFLRRHGVHQPLHDGLMAEPR